MNAFDAGWKDGYETGRKRNPYFAGTDEWYQYEKGFDKGIRDYDKDNNYMW